MECIDHLVHLEDKIMVIVTWTLRLIVVTHHTKIMANPSTDTTRVALVVGRLLLSISLDCFRDLLVELCQQ